MAESIICKRAEEFARRILKACDMLDQRGPGGQRIASQLRRCGPSIGANANEAQGAQSKRDFVAKYAISRKEAHETLYWLRLAVSSKVASSNEIAWEIREAGELRAMIIAAIKTGQANPKRRGERQAVP